MQLQYELVNLKIGMIHYLPPLIFQLDFRLFIILHVYGWPNPDTLSLYIAISHQRHSKIHYRNTDPIIIHWMGGGGRWSGKLTFLDV